MLQGPPDLVGYADDQEGTDAPLTTSAVLAAFAALEAAEPTDRFGVHVNDTVVSVGLTGDEEPTPGLLEAMHAQSQALVSSARLPDTPAPPPLRRSFVARFLLILLAPSAFFLGAMALFAGAGTWAAFALLVLGAGGTMWSALRRHPRR